MEKCPNCGKTPKGGRFCPYCGTDLSKFVAQETAVQDTVEQNPEEATEVFEASETSEAAEVTETVEAEGVFEPSGVAEVAEEPAVKQETAAGQNISEQPEAAPQPTQAAANADTGQTYFEKFVETQKNGNFADKLKFGGDKKRKIMILAGGAVILLAIIIGIIALAGNSTKAKVEDQVISYLQDFNTQSAAVGIDFKVIEEDILAVVSEEVSKEDVMYCYFPALLTDNGKTQRCMVVYKWGEFDTLEEYRSSEFASAVAAYGDTQEESSYLKIFVLDGKKMAKKADVPLSEPGSYGD